MKKSKIRVIVLLLCMSMIIPRQTVRATETDTNEIIENDDNTEIDDEIEIEDEIETSDEIGIGGETEIDDETESDGDEIKTLSDNEIEQLGEVASLDEKDADPEDLAAPTTGAHGSGSYQLNEVGSDYRFYTEYFVKGDTKKNISSAGVDRRTAVKVYAKAGEIILFGSSVGNSQIDVDNHYTGAVTGDDIVITTPSGNRISKDVLLPNETDSDSNVRPYGLGYIKNPTQEKNGPMVNHTDESHPDDYYTPLQYAVTESGVHTFEFHSITGFNPNSAPSGYHPSPKKASENWAQGNTAVAAWDVTVLGKKTESEWEVKSGRAWADYLALTTGGGAGIKSDLDVHVLTHDGYQYKVDFREAVPFGFIFFANNTGFMSAVTDEDSHTTTYRPIYHSFYDPSNDLDYMSDEKIFLHKPNEADSATEETYKIFFNAPSDDLDGITYDKSGVEETIMTAPGDTVTISGLKFNGGSHENIARTGHGGYFTFSASGEAIVTIRLDLRKAIFESEGTMQGSYDGSGIVEITAPVTAGDNSIYWDGKDTDGVVIPAGIYGDSNVVLATEIKRGELHFPVIDMEGLYEGLCVQRINGEDTDSSDCYNLYYNNNPLAYGTIEGAGYSKTVDGSRYVLTDGTKTYKAYTDRSATLSKYFVDGPESISTLKKDDKDYLAQKMFNSSYASLSADRKAIIDAEFGSEQDTFHFEPVNSSTTTMKFKCEGYDGGGNQAGIDAWTYYTQGIDSQLISLAIMDTNGLGMVKGQIFYDTDISSSYNAGDRLLPGIRVRLIDGHGKPLVHTESLPCFDDTGHFMYDEEGKIIHEDRPIVFETVTDANGVYRFTGVPYSLTEDTIYYVQVLLTDVQSEVMRYTCTTSEDVKSKLKTSGGDAFINESNVIADNCGPDGNAISQTDDVTKIYGYKYDRNSDNETVFDAGNAQVITFSEGGSATEIIPVEEFRMIGYCSTVPADNQKDYKLIKHWGTGSHGGATHKISDGLTVELWVWNDNHVKEDNALELSRRTGALVDTQILDEDNLWTYTWKNLDDRLQYYVLEYYIKKKPNGEVIYNDRGEARKVLIGGTMPIFGAESTIPAKGIYGFETNLGDYPETITDPDDSSKKRIPIQSFSENGEKIHANSITKKEKLESVDNNARQYEVTYTLSAEDIDGIPTNIINLTNSQVYDDRAYYVWLDHQTELPDMIAQTYVENGEKRSHALKLIRDIDQPLEDGTYCIKGLSVSSVDAAKSENKEGNATKAFRISDDDGQYALFTATNHGNYKTGTGTRTYQVKYVVDSTTKKPVSITVNGEGALVRTDNPAVKVEGAGGYTVYSWYMTIHVYDVKPDGVFEYKPSERKIVLQEALHAGEILKWTLKHDADNDNYVSYTSNDRRTSGILKNDIYRLPLYKAAENPDMGSCADIVGIAYAGSRPVEDISSLEFEDTYASRYGSADSDKTAEDGKAAVQGSGGLVEVDLAVLRATRINRTQDHANYAGITFIPKHDKARSTSNRDDVFYYKVVVFAEDNTYQYHSYDDIDASEGVEMYTYFTMRAKKPAAKDDDKPSRKKKSSSSASEPSTNPGSGSGLSSGSGSGWGNSGTSVVNAGTFTVTVNDDPAAAGLNTDTASPWTGDDNDLFLWLLIAGMAMAVIVTIVSKGRWSRLKPCNRDKED